VQISPSTPACISYDRGHLGLTKTGELFETWGHSPGSLMVAVAAFSELSGAVLLTVGFLMPLAAAIVGATMFVAGSVNVSKGLWAAQGGYELPLVYGIVGLALAFTGPGRLSLDNAWFGTSFSGIGWGVVSTLVAGLCGVGPVTRARRNRRRVDRHR
jgi:putative oxidoreductase